MLAISAKIFDKHSYSMYRKDDSSFNNVGKEVKGRTHTYYQVLIDQRDCPYIVRVIRRENNFRV